MVLKKRAINNKQSLFVYPEIESNIMHRIILQKPFLQARDSELVMYSSLRENASPHKLLLRVNYFLHHSIHLESFGLYEQRMPNMMPFQHQFLFNKITLHNFNPFTRETIQLPPPSSGKLRRSSVAPLEEKDEVYDDGLETYKKERCNEILQRYQKCKPLHVTPDMQQYLNSHAGEALSARGDCSSQRIKQLVQE